MGSDVSKQSNKVGRKSRYPNRKLENFHLEFWMIIIGDRTLKQGPASAQDRDLRTKKIPASFAEKRDRDRDPGYIKSRFKS